MKLILTRHGQTVDNITGTIQGHLPGKLTALGIEQARKLGEWTADLKINHIYSSDLQRASDTAKEITRFHLDTPITFTEDLRERYLGSLEGMRRDDLQGDVINLEPEDGESMQEACDRARRFLKKISTEHPNDNILFVTHGFFSKCIFAAIKNEDKESVKIMKNFDNTSVSIFEIHEDTSYEVLLFNSTEHLATN